MPSVPAMAGKRLALYSIEERNARLEAGEFPYHRQAGVILFDRFDRRFKEGLELILRGAEVSGGKKR
jgi:TetR/AcrR family tetracycline transcriptional repressor